MIVGVLNTKGGVGKTTLALNLAIARSIEGRDVWLIDGDPQATATQAMAQRAEAGRKPVISISHYVDPKLFTQQILSQAERFDDTILDIGGRDTKMLRAGLELADIVVAPFQPRSFDVWGIGDLAELVEESYSGRVARVKVFAVLNGADPCGRDNGEAIKAVAEVEGIEYLDAPVGRRKAIADAAGAGLSVLEFTPADAKARIEVRRLVEQVFRD